MSLAAAAPYLIVAAAGVQAYGAYTGMQANIANAKSQEQAARANEQIQKNNAQQVAWETSRQEDDFRRRARAQRGEQVASIAQSGIGFDGTGKDLLEQSDINSELDALTIRYEGNLRQKGLLQDASMSAYEAGVARMNKGAARTAGYMGIAGAVASGASAYAGYQNKYASSYASQPVTSNGPLPWLSNQGSYGPWGGA